MLPAAAAAAVASPGPTVSFDDIVDLDNNPRQQHYCRAGAGAIRPAADV
jgi:hypothetical protein